MAREPQSDITELIHSLQPRLAQTNFYRFCQLLEQSQTLAVKLGAGHSAKTDPVRFRPHPGMGFPVSELKTIDIAEGEMQRPTVRTTFLGLYGVMSPLPTAYIDHIAQGAEGSLPLSDFLDIFNHRLTTQFYRVWRKYSYPATFEPGGADRTSQYLLGLVGLGIEGCAAQIGTPVSRFLALLGTMRLPTRTAEGISALVRLLAPNTQVRVVPHDKRRIPLLAAAQLSTRHPLSLMNKPVLGRTATDVNSQVLIQLSSSDADEVQRWLPDGQLHNDLLALLHVYLGARLHARLELKVLRSLLPDAQLSVTGRQGGQLGQTAVLKSQVVHSKGACSERLITIGLGRYQALPEQTKKIEVDENGNYRF